MTPDELQRALAFRQAELQTLSDALGRDLIAGIGQNKRLDEPDQAFKLHIRSLLDRAIGLVATALIHAREPQVAARIVEAERGEYHERQRQQEKAESVAETLAELDDDGGAGAPCQDIPLATGTQEIPE